YSEALENMEKLLILPAEEYLRKAIHEDTTFAAAYLRLAILRCQMGFREECDRYLAKAKKYSHRLSEKDRFRMQLFVTQLKGDEMEILSILQEAVSQNPNDVDLRYELARLYRYQFQDLDRALEEFETVLEMDPTRKMVYNDLGYLFAERGDFNTAFKYFDKYRQLAPDEANPHDSMGEILILAGRFDDAIEQLETALQIEPEFYYPYMRLAQIYTELGNEEKATQNIRSALKKIPNWKMRMEGRLMEFLIAWRFNHLQKAEQILNSMRKDFITAPHFYRISHYYYKSQNKTQELRALENEGFEYYQAHLAEKSDNPEFINNLLTFIMISDLPSERALPVLDKLSKEKLPKRLQVYLNFVYGLSYKRMGRPDKAGEYFQPHLADFAREIARSNDRGYLNLWRYIFESLPTENERVQRMERLTDHLKVEGDRRNDEFLKTMAEYLKAYLAANTGNESEMKQIYRKTGTPLPGTWQIIGPFYEPQVSGFNYPFPPEKDFAQQEVYEYQGRSLRWQPAIDGRLDGYINLDEIFPENTWATVYARLNIYSPERRVLQFRMGSYNGFKVWINEEQVWQHYIAPDAILDHDIVAVVLKEGNNELLLKLSNTIGGWGFYLRVTDENGHAYPDITFHAPDGQGRTAAIYKELN
ncbi:MAG: tetratricopeptide repeat protein, partial [Calditrichia bacterium]